MAAFDVGRCLVMSTSEGQLCVCSPDISLHMCCCRSVITEHLQSWKLLLFNPLFGAERDATVSSSHCLTILCLVSLSFTHKHEWLFE